MFPHIDITIPEYQSLGNNDTGMEEVSEKILHNNDSLNSMKGDNIDGILYRAPEQFDPRQNTHCSNYTECLNQIGYPLDKGMKVRCGKYWNIHALN